MYDTIIVGAGVIGCAVAQALSMYTKNICILEKESDLSEGTTKANSAIIHAGFDAENGTNKAHYNVLGAKMYPELSKRLGFQYEQIGSLVLCFSENDRSALELLMARGIENGVPDLRIIDKNELQRLEPNVSKQAVAALYAPTAGIVCPYGFCQALAENACDNGAEFFFDRTVMRIEKDQNEFLVYTDKEMYRARTIVNAAGLHADEISAMVGGESCSIHARKGEYCVLDRQSGTLVNHTIFQLPGKMGKGVLVTPTVDGNLLVGPSADNVDDKENFDTTTNGLSFIWEMGQKSLDIPLEKRQIITSFAGLRAHPEHDDFIVGRDSIVPGFYQAMGIESPGLSAAPAIGLEIAEQIVKDRSLKMRNDVVTNRAPIARFRDMDEEQKKKAIKENSAHGQIVCRCETVTEYEVLEAILRKPGARTIDGVKRRTRCGMGRCQGGFCMTRVSELLQRTLGLSPEEITKKGDGSEVVVSGGITCRK